MENGKAKQLLDRIQDIVGDGQNVPFAKQVRYWSTRKRFLRSLRSSRLL